MVVSSCLLPKVFVLERISFQLGFKRIVFKEKVVILGYYFAKKLYSMD
jgi:hypothetical protein